MHHLWGGVLPHQLFAPEPPGGFDAPLDEAYAGVLADLVERHAGELAAVIVEPVVQGAGGMRFHSPAYLRLLRELCDEHGVLLVFDEIATGFARTSDEATTYPDSMIVGSFVCLLNENSASDGDIFPAMFRQAGLGPLIGKRSWGGVVGITNRGNLIDGGSVNVPEFGFASPDGKWIIEGEGVTPDIVVENDPKSVIQGKDPQLERAVTEVMNQLKTKSGKLPERPAAPVKTK